MEEKNEQQVMRTVSDEELQQVSGGVDIVSNGECEKYRTQESCLSKQKCCWSTGEKMRYKPRVRLRAKGEG